MAAQFGIVAAAAEGADALVETVMCRSPGGARPVAENDLRHVHASHQPVDLPSPHRWPPARRGRPLPPDATDHKVLGGEGARITDTVFGEALNTPAAGLRP